MPNETKEAKLKLIHLVYGLLAAAVLIGIAIGSLMNQQTTNTDNIDEKVNTDLFEMHQTQQFQQFERLDKSLEKIDKSIETLGKKL